MNTPVAGIQACLERSGRRPLSLEFRPPCHSCSPPYAHHFTSEEAQILQDNLHRFGSLSLHLDPEIPDSIPSWILSTPAPLLEKLQLSGGPGLVPHFVGLPHLFAGHTPKLRSLSLTDCNLAWDAVSFPSVTDLRLDLTESVEEPSSPVDIDRDVIAALRACPALQTLYIDLSNRPSSTKMSTGPSGHGAGKMNTTHRVHLPRLSRMELSMDYSSMGYLLEAAVCPSHLEHMQFCLKDGGTADSSVPRGHEFAEMLRRRVIPSAYFDTLRTLYVSGDTIGGKSVHDDGHELCFALRYCTPIHGSHFWFERALEALMDVCTLRHMQSLDVDLQEPSFWSYGRTRKVQGLATLYSVVSSLVRRAERLTSLTLKVEGCLREYLKKRSLLHLRGCQSLARLEIHDGAPITVDRFYKFIRHCSRVGPDVGGLKQVLFHLGMKKKAGKIQHNKMIELRKFHGITFGEDLVQGQDVLHKLVGRIEVSLLSR